MARLQKQRSGNQESQPARSRIVWLRHLTHGGALLVLALTLPLLSTCTFDYTLGEP
ncbi:MAG: hypothetical protein RBU30_21870 [Polyangia bacterium]|jgi:hypothetical protein|nr:hypothetical protein [Polyangia bacterium]